MWWGKLAEKFSDALSAQPDWMKLGAWLLLIAAGIGWCWGIGTLGLPLEVAKFGGIAIGVGVLGFCFTLLADDSW